MVDGLFLLKLSSKAIVLYATFPLSVVRVVALVISQENSSLQNQRPTCEG